MDTSDFRRAASNSHHRPALLQAMKGDPVLRAAAQKEVARLEAMHQIGQVFDRDHISKTVHTMLTQMLAHAAASAAQEPRIEVT